MKFSLEEFFQNKNYTEEKKSFFSGFAIESALYKKEKDLVVLKINNDKILPIDIVEDLKQHFLTLGINNIKLYFKVKDDTLSLIDIKHYIKAFSSINGGMFNDCVVLNNENGIVLSYIDKDAALKDANYLDDLKLFFYDIGFRRDIDQVIQKQKEIVVETREALPEENKKNDDKPNGINNNGYNQYKPRSRTYNELKIDDLIDTLYNVKFTAEIFKVDERTARTGMLMQTIYVKDENNACIVKVNESKKFTKEIMAQNVEGKCANFYGNYRYDNYLNDYIFEPDQIEFIDKPEELIDDLPEKRVELHAHTKLSEMDGVSSPTEIVNAAYKYGHKAVAITDHLCVNGFHEAQMAYSSLKKKAGDDFDFKVLYGCEFNTVYENLNIVYNPTNNLINDEEYVVFDLETTGLSTRHDYIIEFGAVLMRKGTIVETKDFFVKPPISLSKNITELTSIKESDLVNARTFKECKDEILDFIKNRVLVAHNASFDFGFLNEELVRLNEPKLTNTVIDTLDLSRSLFKTRKSFRLGNMCRQYGIEYNEEDAHRADYDATVLAQVFNLMMKDCAKSNVNTLNDLAKFQGDDAFVKNRAYHTIAIAKNKAGLKDLYKLVSISNTKTLAVFGKANTKDANSDFIAEPRLFKNTLNEHRENLLIGSACFNGEVFEIAQTRSKEELAKAISFFDYIEIQPLENYSPLYEDRESFDKERLKVYLKDIIDEAKRQNKILVATGDTHYVYKDEKIVRDVIITAQAIGGAHHPLYVFDKEKRAKQVTPDQRFKNTREMLEAFAWLEDENLIREMVIDNPNKIANMCENVKPFSNDLFPPVINDAIEKTKACKIFEEPFIDCNEKLSADEYLERLVYYNAHKQYGDNLDPIIEERIKKELDAIIGNGYGVIYFVCHLMCRRSNDDGYIVGSRGSVGSSLVATFSGISECNPLAPHYYCPKCHRIEWVNDVDSGYDLADKLCPECGTKMIGEGQNIPFETFLGFHGDKVPDIDLNFSGEYQAKAHLFTREIFGADNVFRAGTISTIAETTAFGYVSGYCEDLNITNMSRAQRQRLASGLIDIKRTTGQHAGGIVVLPDNMDIEDVTPIQYPANDVNAAWRSTHFEFHDYSDNLLKFDILGHVDPTAMRLFENISGIDVRTIPMNDPKVYSLFYSTEALNIINPNYKEVTGAAGLPEFGTLNTRMTIEETQPHHFSELVKISGLSHGTDVWRGNAQELIRSGIPFSDVIGCRDDIMTVLIQYGLDSLDAFNIMEHVRKGKGLTEDEEKVMLQHNVPRWYIESCRKIKYMFPKAHAVAYCIMAVRVAWFKVYHPEYYYVSYLTLRCDAYEIETMIKDADTIYARTRELLAKMNSRENPASKKEKDIFNTLEVCYEMVSRGYRMTNIDLNRSLATEFIVNPDNNHEIIPPFKIIDGLGDNVAETIVKARSEGEFLSKEDLMSRTSLSQTLIKKLDDLGCLKGLDETNQVSLF